MPCTMPCTMPHHIDNTPHWGLPGKPEGLNRLFTATTLMSSVLIVNVMRQLNNDALQKLTVDCTP